MTTVLVTGGAGFIGSHLIERLIARGDRVVVLDDFNDYYAPAIKRRNVESARQVGAFDLVEGDIRDAHVVRELFRRHQPEILVHLAARAGVRPSLASPLLYEDVNGRGTLLLLEAAREFGTRRVVFASSSSVYGMSQRIPFTEDDPAVEPASPYGATKRAGELYCRTYHALYGMAISCLRFFTVYGPRQRPDMAIHKFVRGIERGEEIHVYGDGSSRRDYTYYEDILEGILGAMRLESGFHIFNLGESRTVTLAETVAAIEKARGKKARTVQYPDQPGDVPLTYADVTRARKHLGYAPRWTLEAGLEKFVSWYRDSKGFLGD